MSERFHYFVDLAAARFSSKFRLLQEDHEGYQPENHMDISYTVIHSALPVWQCLLTLRMLTDLSHNGPPTIRRTL